MLVDEELADQVWEAWYSGYADDQVAVIAWWAMATMRQAIADGWTGHRGFLYAPLWRELYESDEEFRSIMNELHLRIDAMRKSIQRDDQPDVVGLGWVGLGWVGLGWVDSTLIPYVVASLRARRP